MKLKSILATACIIAFIGTMPAFAAKTLLNGNALASYYGAQYHGRQTSSGEIFDMYGMTAAHKTLPFGTMLEVTNLENGNSVVVRVNDRGPFVEGREIDVSLGAAEKLGMTTAGVARVAISIIDNSEATTNTALAGSPNAAPTTLPAPQASIPSSTRSEYMQTSPVPPSTGASMPYADTGAAWQYADTAVPQPPAQPAPMFANEPAAARQYADTAIPQPPAQPAPMFANEPATARQYADTASRPYANSSASWQYTGATAYADPNSPLWRIQLGAFSREENAIRLVRIVRAAGLEPAYERNNETIRVVLPAVEDRNLENVKKALREAGIHDYILRRER